MIVVVEYDPSWPMVFDELRRRIWPAVADRAISIEHVGSTAVPGLAAKPIVDLSVVVATAADAPVAIGRLGGLGYAHCGNLGVDGREAFQAPMAIPRHHLYLCAANSLALRNHLSVRDYLRGHPAVAHEYGELKKRLAIQYSDDIDAYTEGKTDMLLQILAAAGFRSDALETIARVNRKAV